MLVPMGQVAGQSILRGVVALLPALIARALEQTLDRYDRVVLTKDIHTREDQRLLTVVGALESVRIGSVETGDCPHTAIRQDPSINLEAISCRRSTRPTCAASTACPR